MVSNYYYDHFIIPFAVAALVMAFIVAWKWIAWLRRLSKDDLRLVRRGIPTLASLKALWETVRESLLHFRIFRVNPVLGYMHTSLAFGWFLLIAVGWVEASVVLGGGAPLHAHVFFRYFDPSNGGNHILSNVMDALLLLVLSGVALAWFKRLRSKALGLRRTTRHTPFDRVAMSSLWFIFPLRLVAESLMSALKHNGGFLTATLGNWFEQMLSVGTIVTLNSVAWWLYSICLGLFFVSMPFSRYMHIFTEVPLIFLRRYGVRSSTKESSYDNFQIQACSRCGICIDPCQLQSAAGIGNVQSVYFLRDRRIGQLTGQVADNCLMCGRCEARCPVGIELNTLRLNSREKIKNLPASGRYDYLKGVDRSSGEGRTGYFAGCMTLLTPNILIAMDRVFEAAGEDVWRADRDGGVCCGRPLKLSGEIDAARKMMDYNTQLFRKHGITTLVTSCPICLKVFREDYRLDGIEVLHHSEYILRLIEQQRISVEHTGELFTYHDPCELGRGSGIYEQPRRVIGSVGEVIEPAHNHRDALCCGSSVANTVIDDGGQKAISQQLADELCSTAAHKVVTSCPLCKKAVERSSSKPVLDIAEVVAEALGARTD